MSFCRAVIDEPKLGPHTDTIVPRTTTDAAVMASSPLRVLWVREAFWWQGNHSGHDMLPRKIQEFQPQLARSVFKGGREFPELIRLCFHIFFDRIYRKARTNPFYNWNTFIAELQALAYHRLFGADVIHFLYIESTFGLWGLRRARQATPSDGNRPRCVATAHQPQAWWRLSYQATERLSAVDALIVVSRHEQQFFEQLLPGRVHFIRHGVDLDFFAFHADRVNPVPHILFCGFWLRDIETLSRVIDILLARDPHLRIDMVVPAFHRTLDRFFYEVARHPQVQWHAAISDEALRRMYASADVLLLPLKDATANNTLVEALASGLPIVTNLVGGVPDYADPSFAELLPVGDAEGMADAVLGLLADPTERVRRAVAGRRFAEQHLNWQSIASQTLDVYQQVHRDRTA
jgi:glycosyltransferase involved in cell wall biosynthesis